VQAFAADTNGKLQWAGSSSGLLIKWDGDKWSLAADMKSPIHALLVANGDLWVGTDDGLYRYDGTEGQLVDAVGRQPVNSLLLDDQNIWVGTSKSLWRFRDERWTQVGTAEHNLQLGVYAMTLSPKGMVVVGTPYGIGWQPGMDGSWSWYETLDEANNPV